ncbi:uncharacterized protein [Zea mays]|jgi:hypothetical protein|uniref:DUF4220 domain-containing protein n=1 Tax=Zea mays TaxID=4577 RepID=A0A804QPD9_MAIZE|nr:uncharacterized protein LOC103635833 [Zea mays]|eukprot:XP_020398972.1 uncharacterized protein LOC103635833 [Zea mays]
MRGIRESLRTVQGSLLRLEAVVLLSALILAALVLYGSANRRSSDKLLRGAMWMAYSMSYVVVSYAVGIIQDGPFRGETFVLWAAALLLIQASAYSAPVHSRRDVDQRKKLLLQHVLQTGLVLWLIVNATGHNASYRAAIWAFWALNVLKTAAKIAEMIEVSRPDLSVRVVAEYMAEYMAEADGVQQQPAADPATMQGYAYIFHGEEVMEPVIHTGGHRVRENMLSQSAVKSVVTIDQVYQWIDQQPDSDVEKDRAKDFCLAFALFKLLKRRFYGYVPAEAGSEKARSLVLNGLIHMDATGPDAAFRVVEAELAFLYDFFYTRNIVLVGAKTYICIAVAVAGLTMWTAFFGTLGPGYHRLHIGVRNLDRSVTMLLVVITAGLEVFQAVAGFSSNWRYVKTVYRCVRDDRRWSGRRLGHHLWWKQSIAPPETRYWEDKVGQYVLLKRFERRPCNLLSWLTLYLVEPRRQGQKRGRRKPLPPEVKRAVLLWLKQNHCHLSNGVATLRKHHLLPRLAWACRLPMVTDQILAWHVVTTSCDWSYSFRPAGRFAAGDDHHRLVAKKLSNYCAYLVAFVPEMLPDPSYNAEQIFDTAVQQARDHLDGCKTHSSIIARLEEMEIAERPYVQPCRKVAHTIEPSAPPSSRGRRCFGGSSGRPLESTTRGGGRCWPSSGRSSCCSSRHRTTWTFTLRCSAPAASS